VIFVALVGKYVEDHPDTTNPAPSTSGASVVAPAAASTTPASIRSLAQADFGDSYGCAANIITRESGWRVNAQNPSSSAYGLPQALPGSKMAAAGPDWRTNPATQLTWMHSYVDQRYGGACPAWSWWQAHHWY
jgi:hypothetical protein